MLHERPSFLFRGRRKLAQQEIEEDVVEILSAEILRAWDMNGCRPPCCPHVYLLEIGDREFIYVESWKAFNYPDGQFPRRRIEIDRSPLTKRILSVRSEGEVVPLEDSPLDPATDHLSFSGDTECEVVRAEEMPEEMWSRLTAT